MYPSGRKGTFFCYSESYKSYLIYVPGKRHIEISKDVPFHEEDAFKLSKELQYYTNMDSHETRMMEDPYLVLPIQMLRG